ncbi:MAG: hypothetical protein ACI814_002705 [Mariniblastus sp.]
MSPVVAENQPFLGSSDPTTNSMFEVQLDGADRRCLRSRWFTEPLQLAMDNGVKRALVPIENKRQFLEVSGDIMEHVAPVFYGDPKAAAFKAMGMY